MLRGSHWPSEGKQVAFFYSLDLYWRSSDSDEYESGCDLMLFEYESGDDFFFFEYETGDDLMLFRWIHEEARFRSVCIHSEGRKMPPNPKP
jgi:hypothetical protein